MAKHAGRSGGDDVSQPLPPEERAHHAAPEPEIVSPEQLAADVAQIDNAYGDTSTGS